MIGWIDPVNSATQHSECSTPRFERTFVCCRVDPLCESAHDAEAAAAEMAREIVSGLPSLPRRVAAADDRERRQVQSVNIAIHVECGRRIGNSPEQRREIVRCPVDQQVVLPAFWLSLRGHRPILILIINRRCGKSGRGNKKGPAVTGPFSSRLGGLPYQIGFRTESRTWMSLVASITSA